MNRKVILALGLLASVPSTATAKVVCLKKSLSGPLHVRESCKAKEAKLGSFDAVQALLAALSVENGGATIRLSGVNLQIVSGSGATDGPTNGKGNLIVGYDEVLRTGFCSNENAICEKDSDCGTNGTCQSITTKSVKIGSHNLIVGAKHTYTSFGGFVAGESNAITGRSASVCGGAENTASGDISSVSGGIVNTASGEAAAVSGGFESSATGLAAAVSGGLLNLASENESSVCGGVGNVAGPGTPLFSLALQDLVWVEAEEAPQRGLPQPDSLPPLPSRSSARSSS